MFGHKRMSPRCGVRADSEHYFGLVRSMLECECKAKGVTMISILDLAKRRAACRRTLFVAALVLMLLLLGMCLRDKVLNVEASVYSSEAFFAVVNNSDRLHQSVTHAVSVTNFIVNMQRIKTVRTMI